MKSKRLLLGLVALVFAAGSAFASVLTSVTYFVNASDGTSWSCQPVTIPNEICDLQGSSECRIQIQLVSGTGTANAHPDNMCVQTKKDQSLNNTVYSLDDTEFEAVEVRD